MKKYIYLLYSFLIVAIFGCETKEELFSEEFKENIKLRVKNELNTGIVIGVITPDGTDYFSYGVKSLETKEPVDENTVFEIGSITKTFTGLLLANEVIKGELNLDDPMQELLPEGVNSPARNGQSINLIHLANHSSSLPRIPNNITPSNSLNRYSNYTKKQLFDMINSYVLTHDIGSKFEYSNLGMGLLGTLIANKNDIGYEELMLKTIAKPLSMENTRITLNPAMEKQLAKGHNNGTEIKSWKWEKHTLVGCGAINSTAVDMLKYLAANMGLIKSDIYPAMKLSHKYSGSGDGAMVEAGLGWFTTNIEGVDVIWHDGGTSGYMSFAGFTKDDKKGVVVLTNSTGFPDDIGFHLLNSKYKLEEPKPSITTVLNKTIIAEGIDPAIKIYEDIIENQADNYTIKEHDFLKLGFRYLKENKTIEAIAIFKICINAFPESWMAFDLYADALNENNQLEKALENYKKSIELNPENDNVVNKIKILSHRIKKP